MTPLPRPRPARPCPPSLAGAALAAAALLLAGCGDKKAEPEPPKPAAAKPAPTRTAAARPEDSLPAPRCPPPASTAPAGPDVVGLRLGMGFDEALNHARCQMPGAVLAVSPRWLQQVRSGGITLEKQAFTIQRGEARDCDFRKLDELQRCGLGNRLWTHVAELIHVATPGAPGDQAVAGLWREQHWKPGEMPSRSAVIEALREKYGREGQLTRQPHGTMSWRHDAAGQPLAASHPQFNACYGITARHAGHQSWREDCGLSISVDIVPPRDNPELVQSLFVAIVHQRGLLEIGDAMQARLDRMDAARRASEVQKAGGNAPRL